MRFTIPLLGVLASVVYAQAQALSGVVVDTSGAPVRAAAVELLDLDRARLGAAATDAQGQFGISWSGRGSALVRVRCDGFSEELIPLEPNSRSMRVILRVASMRTSVTVTAETGSASSAELIPQMVNLVGRTQIEQRAATGMAELATEEEGVTLQRTAPAMQGIYVRGLVGRNVVVYRDGVRYTTSAQRGGVSTFLNLNDPAHIDSVEILRGPNSAQYGSDSMGGTVNLLSRVPIGDKTFHGELASIFHSATNGFGLGSLSSVSKGRFGAMASLNALRVNTSRTGQGLDSHAAVTRFLGLPSSIMGERLPDTALTQYGGMLHTSYRTGADSQLTGHYERSQIDGSKRYDQLLGGDGNLIAALRNLMLDFVYARYLSFRLGPFDKVSATLSYNTQREERVNQGGQGNPAAAITHQYERNKVWGTNFYLAKQTGKASVLFGGDAYRERMVAPAFSVDPVSNVTTLTRPRVPDGAHYGTYGLFTQEIWEPSKYVRFSGAMRFGGSSYRSQASFSPLVSGASLWPDDSAAVRNLTGRAGVSVRPVEGLRWFLNYSRGFRAPNMTDLGTVGIQGNGFFEAAVADLAGRGAILGNRADDQAVSTGIPVRPLRSEVSNHYESGIHVKTSRWALEGTVFLFDLNDLIVSQTLLLPPGAVGQRLGDQMITRQLASGAILVPAATNPVLVRANATPARSYGFENRLEGRLGRGFFLRENFTYTYMKDKLTGLPPDLEGGTPPPTLNMAIAYNPSARRFWMEVYSTIADRQSRLSSLSLADRRIGAARSRTNIANFFSRGARVHGLVVNNILVPTGETSAQVQQRVLGDAVSAPMFNAIPGYTVFGLRGGFTLKDGSRIFADFSNILDKNYRGLSWGIDGPGRSLTLRYKRSF